MYRVLDHVADLGVEVRAPSLEAVFVDAAEALFDLLGTRDSTRLRIEETIDLEGQDLEDLLHEWLSELLFRCAARKRVFRRFEVLELGPRRLRALARGESRDPSRHFLEREIKAVTLHGLEVTPEAGGWRATVIFDV